MTAEQAERVVQDLIRQILSNQLAIMNQVSEYYRDSSFIKQQIARTKEMLS